MNQATVSVWVAVRSVAGCSPAVVWSWCVRGNLLKATTDIRPVPAGWVRIACSKACEADRFADAFEAFVDGQGGLASARIVWREVAATEFQDAFDAARAGAAVAPMVQIVWTEGLLGFVASADLLDAAAWLRLIDALRRALPEDGGQDVEWRVLDRGGSLPDPAGRVVAAPFRAARQVPPARPGDMVRRWRAGGPAVKAGLAGTGFIAVLGVLAALLASPAETKATGGVPAAVGLLTLTVETQVEVERRFVGRIEAVQSAVMAFEFGGTVDAILVEEGGKVTAGQPLARLSRAALMAERVALEARIAAIRDRLDYATATADRLDRLASSGAASASARDQARMEQVALQSSLTEAEAGMEQLELRLKAAILTAPFDGVVGAQTARVGETVAAGQPVLSLYSDEGAHFRVGFPVAVDPADLREARVDFDGTSHPARLVALRPDVDPRTNTRTAIYAVASDTLPGFGQNATLRAVAAQPATGAWVPVDAMRPDDDGFWSLLTVGPDMVVRPLAVEVLHLRGDRAFVTGAFETGVRIVGRGAHKVVPGQVVRPE